MDSNFSLLALFRRSLGWITGALSIVMSNSYPHAPSPLSSLLPSSLLAPSSLLKNQIMLVSCIFIFVWMLGMVSEDCIDVADIAGRV